MNGTDAGGVHGPVGTILTKHAARQPVAFEAFFQAERVRLLRALYLLTGNDVEDRVELARALVALSPRRREAIVLTALLGYSSADVGRMMGVADPTVRRLAQEARADLRVTLEDLDA